MCDEEENASKEVTSSLNNSSVANSTNNKNKRNETEEETQKGVGSVHLILGPMFAGKTTRLLERVKQLEESVSANVLLLKSDKDTRYAKDKVVTHDGRGRECFPVKSLELEVVVKTVGERKWNECDVVAEREVFSFRFSDGFPARAIEGEVVLSCAADAVGLVVRYEDGFEGSENRCLVRFDAGPRLRYSLGLDGRCRLDVVSGSD